MRQPMAISVERLQAALAGEYEVKRELGRGGMAVVFEAWHEAENRPVALKVLHPELAATVGGERFVREFFLGEIDHGRVPGTGSRSRQERSRDRYVGRRSSRRKLWSPRRRPLDRVPGAPPVDQRESNWEGKGDRWERLPFG